jgi:DNA polymerase III delta prime subunit
MLKSILMTYLVIGNNSNNIDSKVSSIISKHWDRDIDTDIWGINNPDLFIIDGGIKNSIGIDDIKEAVLKLRYTPYKENSQILIIKDAFKLTPQAQNSMLKSLEESSDTTIYILIVENEKQLLPTILSRSQKIYTKEKKEIIDSSDIEEEFQKDPLGAFKYIEDISSSKDKCLKYLDRVEDYFQKKLEYGINKGLDIDILIENINLVKIARDRIKWNGNKKLVLENMYIHIKKGL